MLDQLLKLTRGLRKMLEKQIFDKNKSVSVYCSNQLAHK